MSSTARSTACVRKGRGLALGVGQVAGKQKQVSTNACGRRRRREGCEEHMQAPGHRSGALPPATHAASASQCACGRPRTLVRNNKNTAGMPQGRGRSASRRPHLPPDGVVAQRLGQVEKAVGRAVPQPCAAVVGSAGPAQGQGSGSRRQSGRQQAPACPERARAAPALPRKRPGPSAFRAAAPHGRAQHRTRPVAGLRPRLEGVHTDAKSPPPHTHNTNLCGRRFPRRPAAAAPAGTASGARWAPGASSSRG